MHAGIASVGGANPKHVRCELSAESKIHHASCELVPLNHFKHDTYCMDVECRWMPCTKQSMISAVQNTSLPQVCSNKREALQKLGVLLTHRLQLLSFCSTELSCAEEAEH